MTARDRRKTQESTAPRTQALAATLGWQTLFLSVPIVVGYVWFRWQQHSEESKIRPPGEARDIEQADTELRDSGYGHESTRS